MAFYYRAMNGLGQAPSCTPVPYVTSTGESGVGNLCADDSGKCGDMFVLQQALNYLGYGPLDVDAMLGAKTLQAVKNYADSKGIKYPGSYPGYEVCSALVADYAGESTPEAEPTTGRQPTRMLAQRSLAIPAVKLSRTLKTVAAPPGGQAAPPAGTQDQSAEQQPAEPGFWAALPDWQKYAIIGGGVLVVGGAAYFLLTKKPKAAVANKRSRGLRRKAALVNGNMGLRYKVALVAGDRSSQENHSSYQSAVQAIKAANRLHGEVLIYDSENGDQLFIGGPLSKAQRAWYLFKGSPLWTASRNMTLRAR